MPDKIFYQGADGSYHDAHGRPVDADGVLLDPSADDPNNISAQEAEAIEDEAKEPKHAAKKHARKR
jgi:hypothetical protein